LGFGFVFSDLSRGVGLSHLYGDAKRTIIFFVALLFLFALQAQFVLPSQSAQKPVDDFHFLRVVYSASSYRIWSAAAAMDVVTGSQAQDRRGRRAAAGTAG